jgi:cation:H+ antiporter
MTIAVLGYFLAGAVFLVVGADVLVRGASRLASAFGISPLVIGLTVVAFGTSAPELAVSVRASLTGVSDIALGNVVGSNIFNILLILGLSALITPLVVARQIVRLELTLLIGCSLLLFVMGLDGRIGPGEGVLLVLGIIMYTIFVVRLSVRESAEVRATEGQELEAHPPGKGQWLISSVQVFAGLALLIFGADWLVDSAVAIAKDFGLSELIIGLTIVAAGTSLPEVATSIIAGIRGERDIAVGNVVGSCLFNILAILGISSILAADGITVAPAAIRFDIPVMIAVSMACVPVFFTGYCIDRWEGALFLGYYLAYTIFLIFDAKDHDALPAFSAVMSLFVVPMTVVALSLFAIRAWRRQHAASAGSGSRQ